VRQRIAFILALCASLAATRASADVIDDLRITQDDSGLSLDLATSDALSAPRVRTSAGMVRLWFSDVANDPRVERRGDGGSIRWARLWPGVGGSATLQIRLGDRRRLDASDVDVSRIPGGTRVHIAAVLLPPRRHASAPAATGASPEADDTPASEPSEVALAETSADSTREGSSAEPTPEASTPEPRAAGLGPQPATGGGGFAVMLLITVLLGSVFGVVKLVARRRSTRSQPEIDVVSSKRLGPRHQLVVVRALGEDHLLSINRGETERLASVPSPEQSAAELPAQAEAPADLLGRLREGLGLRIAEADSEPEAPAPKLSLDDGGRFGSQLMRAAAAARYGASASKPNSESVAGLMRLRERAGL